MILGAAIGMACGPPAGRLVDRHGALPLGLRAATGMALVPTAFMLPLPTFAMLALLVAMNPLFTFLATAMYPPAAEGADRLGVSHGAAYGLLSISWAVGYGVGPLVGAFVAAAGGDAAGFGAAALAAFGFVAVALRAARRARLAVPA
jgi:MFS family permease